MFTRRTGVLVMEYSQDRLNERIDELEAEVNYMQETINAYRDMDKDRAVTETAIFVVGILIGIAVGFYVS
jgi:tetrahydromethanopterin S-methyltransferase subunit B